MDMGIPALSTNMAQTQFNESWGVGMVKKAIDLTEQTGQQIIEMMESTAVTPGSVNIKI